MAAKPTSLPRWATGGGAGLVEPTEGKKDNGWVFLEKPAFQYFNWLFNLIYQWVVYVDEFLTEPHTWTAPQVFTGAGGLPAGDFNGAASNANGVVAAGDGTGAGVTGAGGANGPGGVFSAGGGNNVGLDAYASGTAPAIRANDGGVQVTGTQPTSSADPGQNVLHATNMMKAWGRIVTDGAGGYSVLDGFNIASCTVTSTYVLVVFARAFANNSYSITFGHAWQGEVSYDRLNVQTNSVRVQIRNSSGTLSDPTGDIFDFSIHCVGRQ